MARKRSSSPASQPDDAAPPDGGSGDDATRKLLAACAQEPETDIGNGRRFRRRFGDLAEGYAGAASYRAIAVAHIGWHVFDGRRWKEDEDGSLVRPLAHETVETIADERFAILPSASEAEAIAAGETARDVLKRMVEPEDGFSAEQLAENRSMEDAVRAGLAARAALAARRGRRLKFARSSCGSSKVSNALAEALPYTARKVQDLNTDRYALNCRSGTIRFVEVENPESDPADPRMVWTARLDPHDPTDMITKMVEAHWTPPDGHDPETPPPEPPARREFDAFFARVQPKPEMRAFLKRLAGYCLLGIIHEQVMVFFHGAGANGKSTFVDLLCFIFGDYAVTLSIDSFAGDDKRRGGEATPDLARLPGARLVAASEPEAGVKLKDALVKTLTGGDRLPVRRLHKDYIEVEPHFTMILSGNHKPRIDDDSDGIWRRVLLVPWEVQIPRGERDKKLPDRLKANEADGVFAWAIEGALDYLNHGLGVPEGVRAASQEYREESDPIGTFVRQACVVSGDPGAEEKSLDLFMAYERFADAEGVFKFNRSTFDRRWKTAAMRAWEGPDGQMRQFYRHRSNGATTYRGIQVRAEWRPAMKAGEAA